MMKKQILTITFLFFLPFLPKAQVYENPIAGKQSHPELEITQIEITNTNTIISLEVTNKRENGGWFCADRNISIKNSEGVETYQLIKSENIPTCPENYEFSYAGEILKFKLHFPKISNKIKYLDLIENCSSACFSFYGIILDNEHNDKIRAFEKAFELYQNDQFMESIPYFEKVLKGSITIDSQIYGLSYYYLIVINNDLNDKEQSK